MVTVSSSSSSSISSMNGRQSLSSSTTSCTITAQTARNSAIAGYAAGTTGVVLGHPLDSIKVWVQTNSMGQNKHFATASSTAASHSTKQAPSSTRSSSFSTNYATSSSSSTISKKRPMSTLIQQHYAHSRYYPSLQQGINTLRALYSGVSGPLVTVGLVQSINFMTYDTTRRALYYQTSSSSSSSSSSTKQAVIQQQQQQSTSSSYLDNDPLAHVAIAGFCAGTVLALVTAPLIGIKTHQQVHGTAFATAARHIWMSPHGTISIRQAYVGIVPHLVSETFGRALYYTVYEASKRAYTRHMRQTTGPEFTLGWPERMLFAGMAGVACWAAIFPFDALRSRMYHQATSHSHGGATSSSAVTMKKVVRQMWQEGALYRGFGLTALRAGPVAAAVLPVYDYVLERLSAADS